MDSKDPQADKDEAEIQIAPEDSPRLQAIEALEAREVDPNPKPFDPASLRSKPRLTKPTVVEPTKPAPKPVEKPVVVPAPVPAPIPEPVKAPEPAPITPQVVVPKPTPKPVEKPKVPKTNAEEMAEELATLPPTRTPFEFFKKQLSVRKPPLAIILVAAILFAAAIGYFIYSTQS